MSVLEPGEPVDSLRVKAESGASAVATLHCAYEQWGQYGRRPPRHLAGVWDDYVAMLAAVPEDVRHLRVHEGHNCWVVEEEEELVTKELREVSCLIGTPAERADRLAQLGAPGLRQVVLLSSSAEKGPSSKPSAQRCSSSSPRAGRRPPPEHRGAGPLTP